MQRKALEITSLHKGFGEKKVLNGVNLSLNHGEFLGLMGLNGSGKTTLVNCVTGLSTQDSGQIKVYGHDTIASSFESRFVTGYMPQDLNINNEVNWVDLLCAVGMSYGLTRSDTIDKILQLAKSVGLYEKINDKFFTLSGGMKRRVLMIRALLHDPKLVIVDEPTTGLDPIVRRDIWDLLKKLHSEGRTIVLTSHYLQEIEELCTCICLLSAGQAGPIDIKEKVLIDITLKNPTITVYVERPLDSEHILSRDFPNNSIQRLSPYSVKIILNKADRILELVRPLEERFKLVDIRRERLEQVLEQ